MRVPRVRPGHLRISIVRVRDIVIKSDSNKRPTFSDCLARNIRHPRCIIDRCHRKCCIIKIKRASRISRRKRYRFTARPFRTRSRDRCDTIDNRNRQLRVPRICPRHLRINIVRIRDIVIKSDRRKRSAFSDRLTRNVCHYRCIIDRSHSKCRIIRIRRASRISRRKRYRFTARPLGVRGRNRGNAIAVDANRQVGIPRIYPGHLRISIVRIRDIVIESDRRKRSAFGNCLARNICYHRRIIHRCHRKCCIIKIERASRISRRKRYRLTARPFDVWSSDRGNAIAVDANRQVGIPRIYPGHLRISIVRIRDIVIESDRRKRSAFGNCLARNICYHRRIIHRCHRKCCIIKIERASRISRRKRYRLTARPFGTRSSDRGNAIAVYANCQVGIPRICPGHLRISIVRIRDIVIKSDRRKRSAFGNCLTRNVGHHRSLIPRAVRLTAAGVVMTLNVTKA